MFNAKRPPPHHHDMQGKTILAFRRIVLEERMRPGFLEGVAARNVEDQRRGCLIGAQMQVARDKRAVPGDVEVLDAVGSQGDHLVVAAADSRIQIALLVVVLEDDVLGTGVQDGGLEVEIERRLGMAGGGLGLG